MCSYIDTILKHTQPSTLDSLLLLGACFNVLQYGNHFGTLTPVFLNLFEADAVYTAKTTVIPESSTVYFVALAFHLILGGAERVRTSTALLTSGLQPGALPLRRLLH